MILATWSDWFDWLPSVGTHAAAIVLVVMCFLFWLLNLIALPGNWLSVGLVALYSVFGPDEGRIAIGMTAAVTAFAMALLGEIFEFAAGAVGAKKAGASRRATLYAMIGSMLGAMIGAFIGVPVPLIGSVIAAVLFGGIGAMAGAMYGEWSDGRSWRENWMIGQAAFWGRTVGTLGKVSVGLVIVGIALVGVIL